MRLRHTEQRADECQQAEHESLVPAPMRWIAHQSSLTLSGNSCISVAQNRVPVFQLATPTPCDCPLQLFFIHLPPRANAWQCDCRFSCGRLLAEAPNGARTIIGYLWVLDSIYSTQL
jgi:hypothetical protein